MKAWVVDKNSAKITASSCPQSCCFVRLGVDVFLSDLSFGCPYNFHNALLGLKTLRTLISLDKILFYSHHCDGYKSNELMNLAIDAARTT